MPQRLHLHLIPKHYRLLIKQLSLLIALSLPLAPEAICADIIVNSSNQHSFLSRKELLNIYTMRQRYWPDGTAITVYILTDPQAHKEFCTQRLKIFPHQLRSRWDRLVYSGTGKAPIEVHSETEMISRIKQHHGSIGYVHSSDFSNKVDHNDDIKTITVQ